MEVSEKQINQDFYIYYFSVTIINWLTSSYQLLFNS